MMAHNGAKAGVITSPTPTSTARVRRVIFLVLILCIIATLYYCWTMTAANSMLQDRVNRLARDFSLMRSQRNTAERNYGQCRSRLRDLQLTHDSFAEELKREKEKMSEMQSKQEADSKALSSCDKRLKLLALRKSDDLKAVTQEVKECRTQLDNFTTQCSKFGRVQQLRILRAVREIAGKKVLHDLRDKYDINIAGVESGGSRLGVQYGQPTDQQRMSEHEHAQPRQNTPPAQQVPAPWVETGFGHGLSTLRLTGRLSGQQGNVKTDSGQRANRFIQPSSGQELPDRDSAEPQHQQLNETTSKTEMGAGGASETGVESKQRTSQLASQQEDRQSVKRLTGDGVESDGDKAAVTDKMPSKMDDQPTAADDSGFKKDKYSQHKVKVKDGATKSEVHRGDTREQDDEEMDVDKDKMKRTREREMKLSHI